MATMNDDKRHNISIQIKFTDMESPGVRIYYIKQSTRANRETVIVFIIAHTDYKAFSRGLFTEMRR